MRKIHKLPSPALTFSLLLFLLFSSGSSAFALSQTQLNATHKRAEALQALLDLNSTQTDSIEIILRQTFEYGEQHRKRFADDYYALAQENQKEMDSMHAHVDALLTHAQRDKYHLLQKTAPVKYSSRAGEVLARRLLLDSSQSRTVDAILSYAERDIKKIRQETNRKVRRNGGGFGSGLNRGAMLRRRSKLLKAFEAIEKILSKAQKKEFQDFKQERMDEFRPGGNGRGRERSGGF